MEKFDSISHFLESGSFEYCIYEMGRKVSEIPNSLFSEIENQQVSYPYPFLKKASFALMFWPKLKKLEATIWFLQFPIDELGFLKQSARDAFLIDLLEQTGKNIQAKQTGEVVEDGLGESPFAFKPREDRLALFHAIATALLGKPPSQYYQYAHDYLLPKQQGGPGFEQWQFLGLQGIADVVTRLNEGDNEALLGKAIATMPDVPLTSYAQALENIEIGEALFLSITGRIDSEMREQIINVALVSALIRAFSSYSDSAQRIKVLQRVLSSVLSAEVEILVSISGRSWGDLKDSEFCKKFLDILSQHKQMAFNAIISDLIQVPGMRDLILNELRSESRTPQLTKRFGAFMQGITD